LPLKAKDKKNDEFVTKLCKNAKIKGVKSALDSCKKGIRVKSRLDPFALPVRPSQHIRSAPQNIMTANMFIAAW
jgi:hypothetical protein